jgi:hypothetical protein
MSTVAPRAGLSAKSLIQNNDKDLDNSQFAGEKNEV